MHVTDDLEYDYFTDYDVPCINILNKIDLHKKILNHKKFIDSNFDTNWLGKEKFY